MEDRRRNALRLYTLYCIYFVPVALVLSSIACAAVAV